MTSRPKHHQGEYLEQFIRGSPGGVTVADVCRHFSISTRESLTHLRKLAADKRIGMRIDERGAMVFRIKEQVQ